MSIDWFRSWHGAPTDPKWLSIARRADVGVDRVICVVWGLMDCASQAGERGSIDTFDVEGFADFTSIPEPEIQSVIRALQERGVLDGFRFKAWDKRQPKRERDQDLSTDRVRAFRQRQHHETPRNATERPDKEKRRVDKSREEKKEKERESEFVRVFWPVYPNKTGKPAALRAWHAARKRAELSDIMGGLKVYIETKPGDRNWMNPATFLNQDRWADEPAPVAVKRNRSEQLRDKLMKEAFDGEGEHSRRYNGGELTDGLVPIPAPRSGDFSEAADHVVRGKAEDAD